MHRDKKVGLALAILLVSVVGAFFFREDSPRAGGTPELKDPRKLDDEIAQRDKSPYPEATTAKPRSTDRSAHNRDPNDLLPWELPDSGRSEGNRTTTQRGAVNSSRDPFDQRTWNSTNDLAASPFRSTDDRAVPIPPENSEWQIPSNELLASRLNANSPAAARTHVVADGDTLSSIAGKYLGSQARYLDIFQANKDQLKSPNDLKVGMTLTIPERAGDAKAKASSRSTPAEKTSITNSAQPFRRQNAAPTSSVSEKSSPPSSTGSTAPSKKPAFKPAKTSPALRRSAEAEELNGKTLSQVPPRDVPELDEGILAELERDTDIVASLPTSADQASRVARADGDLDAAGPMPLAADERSNSTAR